MTHFGFECDASATLDGKPFVRWKAPGVTVEADPAGVSVAASAIRLDESRAVAASRILFFANGVAAALARVADGQGTMAQVSAYLQRTDGCW